MLRTARLTPASLRAVRGYASAAAKPAAGSKYSPLSAAAAEEVSSKWKGTSATGGKTKNYIGGEFTESKATKWLEVRDPVSKQETVLARYHGGWARHFMWPPHLRAKYQTNKRQAAKAATGTLHCDGPVVGGPLDAAQAPTWAMGGERRYTCRARLAACD